VGAGEFGKTRSACNTFMMLQRMAAEWYSERVREKGRLKGKQHQEEGNEGREVVKPKGRRGTMSEGENR